MTMKKNFEVPEIEIVSISAQDVITTSVANGQINPFGLNETPDW